ncbi:hypothetical protein D9615_004233 [Tricholomella constricta]|uniref:Uncharacterized protein n=1 Tax=Tricholomella constricta TaxID=117010 RepID=A0A8H5HEY1_9AGAR|nr:hypothetical protein D9615_004233 [Tricholomella constricta]
MLMLYPTISSSITFLSLVAISYAQHNVIVNNTSPLIQYEGNAADAPICRIENGTIVGGSPGCYNFASPCTDGVTMGQGGSGAASFSFKGSAVYITSALHNLSPIYTVTLDGKSTDVDGARESGPFICSTLFAQEGLDPSMVHQVRLNIKGPSPTRNQSIPDSDQRFGFSLISFTYTEGGTDNNATDGTDATTTKDASVPTTPSSGARALGLSCEMMFGLLVIAWSTFILS